MAFVKALVELQKACGVDGLKMSDYGITKEDMAKCAANARHTMGGLFELDPYALSLDETTQIMMNAYKQAGGTHKKKRGPYRAFFVPMPDVAPLNPMAVQRESVSRNALNGFDPHGIS